jgi:hypothetical protein
LGSVAIHAVPCGDDHTGHFGKAFRSECEVMATWKKIPLIVMKARIFIVGFGIYILTGCTLLPSAQDLPDQPASIPTAISSSATTPVEGIETATAFPTERLQEPTTTLTSIPSPIPAKASTTFGDAFDDNRNNWYTDPTLAEIVDGKYSHKVDCPNSNVSPDCGRFIKMPFTFPRNFRMEIDTTLVKSSTGASVTVAFEVRRGAEYYYITYSITDSQYQIRRISQFGIFTIIPETSSDLIKTAVGSANNLGIEMENSTLTPLLNGQELAPAYDGKIPKAGDSYLVILVARGHSAELYFDNLTVNEIK